MIHLAGSQLYLSSVKNLDAEPHLTFTNYILRLCFKTFRSPWHNPGSQPGEGKGAHWYSEEEEGIELMQSVAFL